jgi:ubiquinone biosynthesis protein UbiJ
MRTQSRRASRAAATHDLAHAPLNLPAPRAIVRALAHGPALPPASALATVLNVMATHRAPRPVLDVLHGRVIAISVAGHAADCRIALTRRGFSPRARRAPVDLTLAAGPYELYLLARGLVGADELIHAGRLEITGDAAVRAAFLRVLSHLDWSALPESSRRILDGLATLHMRWRH